MTSVAFGLLRRTESALGQIQIIARVAEGFVVTNVVLYSPLFPRTSPSSAYKFWRHARMPLTGHESHQHGDPCIDSESSRMKSCPFVGGTSMILYFSTVLINVLLQQRREQLAVLVSVADLCRPTPEHCNHSMYPLSPVIWHQVGHIRR